MDIRNLDMRDWGIRNLDIRNWDMRDWGIRRHPFYNPVWGNKAPGKPGSNYIILLLISIYPLAPACQGHQGCGFRFSACFVIGRFLTIGSHAFNYQAVLFVVFRAKIGR